VTKHERFLQIEPSSADDAPESEAADRARIAAVLEAAPVSAAAAARIEIADGAPAGDGRAPDWAEHATRMIEAPATETRAPDLALDVEVAAGQPFVRCARCGADSSIHATVCQHCAELLDTSEQRAFNDRVWDAQQRRSEDERAALAELAAARRDHAERAFRSLPEPGMKLPPELLEAPGEDGPLLLGALLLLQEPRWRWVAGALAVALPLFLVTLGGAILGKVGWFLVTLLMLSLLPRSVGRRLLELWSGFRGR
jgi:hypothetical protein